MTVRMKEQKTATDSYQSSGFVFCWYRYKVVFLKQNNSKNKDKLNVIDDTGSLTESEQNNILGVFYLYSFQYIYINSYVK